jgi:two-component system, LytTR family, response regulator LytT
MKVLIIEDEILAAEKLAGLLITIDPTIEIMGKLQSVLESINWLHSQSDPDLIFMDIQLDDGICFEIFDAVKIKTPVIFTTAYDSYAIRAFQVNSVDYLLKPIEKEPLAKAIEKYKLIFEKGGSSTQSVRDLSVQIVKSYKTRFFVRIGNHFHSIPVDNIECFYIVERAVFFKTNNGKNYILDYSLDQVQQLIDPEKFFRINRNYLIQINAIQDIYNYSSSRLGIKINGIDHLDLIVSREKVGEFKKWLDR